jgi:uncharacterized Ntn-hydrolase superfamily protein
MRVGRQPPVEKGLLCDARDCWIMPQAPLSGTLSIAAIDRRSGQVGAASVSQSFSIGSKSIWSEPGVGVVVAQGTVEPSYGSLGLALLGGGKTPAHALKSLLATDPRPDLRQVMIIDHRGRTAAHTGKNCLPEAGFAVGRGFCVQANFVNTKRAWRTMARAFRAEKGELSLRMVSALEAGEQAAKGARRGGPTRSAAVVVVKTAPSGVPWEGKVLDLRIESGEAPLKQLRGMLRIMEAQERAELGENLMSRGETERGEKEFARAVALASDSFDVKLRFALALLGSGDRKRGTAVLRSAMGRGLDFKAILQELSARGMVADKSAPKD